MSTLTLPVNLLGFVLAAVAVWLAGARLTRYVDAIAERQGLGRAFMGFLVLATATQLPEIVTNSTAALRGAADLVLNSMFGGISMQTAVLAVADLAAVRYALTYLAQSSFNLLQAALLVVILGLLLAVTLVGDVALLPNIGLAPVVLLVLYLAIVNLLWRQQHRASWQPASVAGSTGRSSGNLLAQSLPEVSTTLTAVRLGRHSMAVADIFGSNLIMVALLLPADVLYRPGLLLDHLDASARFALTLGVLVTAIYLTGLILRAPQRWVRLGWDSWAVLGCYGAGLLVLYQLR